MSGGECNVISLYFCVALSVRIIIRPPTHQHPNIRHDYILQTKPTNITSYEEADWTQSLLVVAVCPIPSIGRDSNIQIFFTQLPIPPQATGVVETFIVFFFSFLYCEHYGLFLHLKDAILFLPFAFQSVFISTCSNSPLFVSTGSLLIKNFNMFRLVYTQCIHVSESAKNVSVCSFIQHCIVPRCAFSSVDAMYCAHFLYMLHINKTPNFSSLICYDRVNCIYLSIFVLKY